MTDETNPKADAQTTDQTLIESSPSAGWRETAALMHAGAGVAECEAPGCDRDGKPIRVVDDTDGVLREGVRCSTHEKDFLEVTS